MKGITINKDLLEAVDIIPYEAVCIWDVDNGNRFETYAVGGECGSGAICINGPAARMVAPKDLVIIASFVSMDNAKALQHEPKLVFVDDQNRMLQTSKEVAGQGTLKKVVW